MVEALSGVSIDTCSNLWDDLLNLYQIVKIKVGVEANGRRVRSALQVLAKDCNLRLCRVAEQGDFVISDLGDETDFVDVSAATNDLDMVTLPEKLPQGLDRCVDSPTAKLAFGDS
jgi:hypothetical protein